MINIQESKVYTPTWGGNTESGDPITVKIKRMPLGDFWKMSTAIEGLTKAVNSTDLATKAEEVERFAGILKPFLQNYTDALTNVSIDGKPITSAQLYDHPGLFWLTLEILTELIRFNSLEEQLKKKSVAT